MRAGFILSEVGSGLKKNFSMVLSVVLVTFVSLLAIFSFHLKHLFILVFAFPFAKHLLVLAPR